MAAPPIIERHLPHFHRRVPVLEPVRAATTANIAIATALNNGDTLDGVTLATGDRVLVKNQSTASQNGIYVVGAAPDRDYDLSTDDPDFGFLIYVREGTTNAGTLWRNTNTSAPTIGSTSITFSALTGAAIALDDLSDVAITSPAAYDYLVYDGSGWVNSAAHWKYVVDSATGTVLIDAGTGAGIEAWS